MKKRIFLILSILAFGLFFVPNVASAEVQTQTVNDITYSFDPDSEEGATIVNFGASNLTIGTTVDLGDPAQSYTITGIADTVTFADSSSNPIDAITIDATGAENLSTIGAGFFTKSGLTFKFKDNVTLKKADYSLLEADTLLGNTYEYKGGDIVYDADGTTVKGYKVHVSAVGESRTIASSFNSYNNLFYSWSLRSYDYSNESLAATYFLTDSDTRLPELRGATYHTEPMVYLTVKNWFGATVKVNVKCHNYKQPTVTITSCELFSLHGSTETMRSQPFSCNLCFTVFDDDGLKCVASGLVHEIIVNCKIADNEYLYLVDSSIIPTISYSDNSDYAPRVFYETPDGLILEFLYDAEFHSANGFRVAGATSDALLSLPEQLFYMCPFKPYFVGCCITASAINLDYRLPQSYKGRIPLDYFVSFDEATVPVTITHAVADMDVCCTYSEGTWSGATVWMLRGDDSGNAFVGPTSQSIGNTTVIVTTLGSGDSSVGTDLVSVDLSKATDLKTINPYAFQGCTGLTTLTIPANVTTLSGSSFDGCTALTTLTFADGSPYKVVTDNGNKYITNTDGDTLIWFFDSNTATEFTIPDGITTIAKDAFTSGSELKKVILPSTFSSLNADSFSFNGIVELPEYVDPDAWKAEKTLVITRTTQDLVYADALIGATRSGAETETDITPTSAEIYTIEKIDDSKGEGYALKLQIREGAFVHPDDFRVSVNGIEQEFQTADENGVYTFALPLDAPTNNINIEAKYDAADIGKFIPGASSYAILHTTYRTETTAGDPDDVNSDD